MTTPTLKPHPSLKRQGPVLVLILDGVGIGAGDAYDAVAMANTPTLDALFAGLMPTPPAEAVTKNASSSALSSHSLARSLRAHGLAVGLPTDDDMGNSEVGHNALGSGRVVVQGAGLVDRALEDGRLTGSDGFRALVDAAKRGGALHLLGLLSDGGVHSRLDQVLKIIDHANDAGVKRLRLHVLTDGRDVRDKSAHEYIAVVEEKLKALAATGFDGKIASGGGRMHVTMDRYESDWRIVERGWNAHVHGDARTFSSATSAIETFRKEDPQVSDQYLPAFVVVDENGPVGKIKDGDAVLCFNFRGDRVIEISRAFDEGDSFTAFDRGQRPKVVYAGMMEYDGDLKIPRRSLVAPPRIDRTSGEYLAAMGVRTFAVSETHKYGHVTYFWNGNRSGKFDAEKETYDEIPSDPRPFTSSPEMRADEIATRVVRAIESGKYDMVRVNVANGDMIGHTGDLAATIAAMVCVDDATKRMVDAIHRVGGQFIVTADHGNADDMALRTKSGAPLLDAAGHVVPRTSHTLAPVPFVIGGNVSTSVRLRTDLPEAGLANVAATIMNLLGFEAPDDYAPSLISVAK